MCGPPLTLIPPLTRTQAKNRVSDFHVSGGPPVIETKLHQFTKFVLIVLTLH